MEGFGTLIVDYELRTTNCELVTGWIAGLSFLPFLPFLDRLRSFGWVGLGCVVLCCGLGFWVLVPEGLFLMLGDGWVGLGR